MMNTIRNSKITPYKSINKQELRDAVWKIFSKPSVTRQAVMYTGKVGMWNFNWLMLYGEMLQCKYYVHSFSKLKSFRYFSLFNKSGLYKLKVNGEKFEFFRGTILINTIHEVVNMWEEGSGDMYSKKTKEKLVEVNKYIKYLEKL